VATDNFARFNAPVCTPRPLALSGAICYNCTMGRKARPLASLLLTSGTGGAPLLPCNGWFTRVSGSWAPSTPAAVLGPLRGFQKH